MTGLGPLWDALLAGLAPFIIGFFVTKTERWKAWRSTKRTQRAAINAVPTQLREVVAGMYELRECDKRREVQNGEILARLDDHTETLAGQNRALADMTAVAYGQMMQDPQPRFVCDNAGSNRVVNTAFARLLRCGRDELSQYGYRRFIPESLNPGFASGFAAAAQQHRTFEIDVVFLRAEGSMFWAQVLLVPHPEDHPPATHWNGFIRYLREYTV